MAVKNGPDHAEKALARIEEAQRFMLTSLDLSALNLTTIPECIGKLRNLYALSLRNNRITNIPASIGELVNLRALDLSSNRIPVLPTALANLVNLKQLQISNNPLPDELLAAARGGVQRLFRYLRSTAKGTVYPRTVKLVLLGEPQSGKTTLLEALTGNLTPCDPVRLETLGINVLTIEKSHPIDGQPMYLSAWDFAGQHIEHATHQFFMTENAIYLVLWNARQGTESGKRDLWYWLELLKMRVRDAKFLLVATHTKHTPPDLNLAEIERIYDGCQGHFTVELTDLSGFENLERKILDLAANSPSLRAEWPATWLPVRSAVREIRKQQPHMTPHVFRQLMHNEGVRDRESQRDLARQLHDLGEVLYFQERDELSNLVILDPEWLTELIALVVRSKAVRERGGILTKAELDELWKTAALEPDVREHLILLMAWFDLTYPTGHETEIGIVVEALPYSTPESLKEVDLAPDRPRMEMIFHFSSLQRRLPPGIPTWGIARAHRFSMCKPWRDAAAFRDRDTNSQALIVASDTTKEIRLRVAADYPPFFFGRMEAILRDTFRRYPGAVPERRFPCPCSPNCRRSFLFESVLRRLQDNKQYVTCDESGADVAIQSLLTGFPRPHSVEGRLAFESEMRRRFTEQLRAQRERMEKTCPSVFTLLPTRDFKQLETWVETVTRDEELELVLYCEHESGWHATAHSVYRFRPNQEWLAQVKKHWKGLVSITKSVGPLAKAVGKAAQVPWVEALGLAVEKLPAAAIPPTDILSSALGPRTDQQFIELEARFLLERLINNLDTDRTLLEPKNGGLYQYLVDDGRLLWLCPDHLRLYRSQE